MVGKIKRTRQKLHQEAVKIDNVNKKNLLAVESTPTPETRIQRTKTKHETVNTFIILYLMCIKLLLK